MGEIELRDLNDRGGVASAWLVATTCLIIVFVLLEYI